MSRIALTPNASGTGTLTIAAPNTNTDRTLTLPDSSGTFVVADTSGNIRLDGVSPAIGFAETDTTDIDARVRLQGGDLLFETVTDGGTLVQENLRLADNGAIGIGGTNYGTSGQVLTSGGSGVAPSWANVDVGAATAGFTTASVGTFAFCNNQSGSTVGQNATVAGSSLRLSDSRDLSGSALAGTWRNMGNSIVTGAAATLFLRIS
jgi:hypothetical protein